MTPVERERQTGRCQCCNVSCLSCLLFTVLLIVALFFLIWQLHPTTSHNHMSRFTRDDHTGHKPTDNVWWKFMNFSKTTLNITGDCYICSLIPHTHEKTVLMEPVPAATNVTMCAALFSWQFLTTSMTPMTKWCNDPYFLQPLNWRAPIHFSNLTNLTNADGIHVRRTPGKAHLAFSRECQSSDHSLGHSQAQEIIPIPSWNMTGRNLAHRWGVRDNKMRFLMKIFTLNVSAFLSEQN